MVIFVVFAFDRRSGDLGIASEHQLVHDQL
jgi:hypothetical protein